MNAWADPYAISATVAAPFFGSLAGVLIRRLPLGEPVVLARSRCPSCGHLLGPLDLVPLLSWVARAGRCRYCAQPIGGFYPGVEIAAIVLALWAGAVLSGWLLWATCGLGWALLALAVIDSRRFVLPDQLTLPLILAGLAVAYALDPSSLPAHAMGATLGYGSFLGVAFVYRALRGCDGLGLGDAKLLAAAGAWVSWVGLPSVVLWACASAFATLLVSWALGRRVGRGSRVAFGPHLALGFWLVWLYGYAAIDRTWLAALTG